MTDYYYEQDQGRKWANEFFDKHGRKPTRDDIKGYQSIDFKLGVDTANILENSRKEEWNKIYDSITREISALKIHTIDPVQIIKLNEPELPDYIIKINQINGLND